MRTPSLLASALLALSFSPAAAQDSRPTSKPAASKPTAISKVFAAARKAKVKLEGRHDYFLGKNPGVALIEHQTKLSERGLEAIFVEHASNGEFVCSSYLLDSAGKLLELTISGGTRDSYPAPTRSQRFLRVDDDLVEQTESGKDGKTKKAPLTAFPMSFAMFVLPSLTKHLPATLKFVPVFEAEVHFKPMALTYSAEKGASIVVDGKAVVVITVDSKGKVEKLETSNGNVIKAVPETEAEEILAKLRPA
jgi:hypothetical protein